MRVVSDEMIRKVGRYNWDEICDGKTRELIPGKDFHCAIGSFRVQFSNECRTRGLASRTTTESGRLYVMAVKPNAKRRGK